MVLYNLKYRHIVCGKAARWWDEEIKEKIRLRRQVYKEISSGREDKWGEYYKLRSEIKELVRKKKLDIWNEVIDKANKDFYENRKEFWAFVGRTLKGNRKGIVSLKNTSGSLRRESWKYALRKVGYSICR